MAREHNFLLAKGEYLTAPVQVPSGGGDKNPPYDFETARSRVAERLASATLSFSEVPADACPHDEVVAVVTMHPRYVSKSDFPQQLLKSVGLRAVGSRSREITPDAWGIKKPPASAVTEDYFVAGKRSAFTAWAEGLSQWTDSSTGATDLSHLENVSPLTVEQKLRGIPERREIALFEVVVHEATPFILKMFEAYARKHGGEALMTRRRDVRGLSFIPVRAPTSTAEDIARFSFVRVLRGMPTLRPFRPGILRTQSGFLVTLSDMGPMAPKVRAVVFDGGLPPEVDMSPWVNLVEPDGIGPAVPEYQRHGLAVTSSLLFGPLEEGIPAPRPLCSVDHVRVLDARSGVDDDEMMYVDVLDRVLHVLDTEGDNYDFVNISLGPRLAVSDDEVTAWTALIDDRLANMNAVATVAAGNDGELDAASGLNRIQPPADGVNVVAVGASDRLAGVWKRSEYSCVGPGRSPGVIKPDGVAFGGSTEEPFMVLGPGKAPRAVGEQGTSFAAPLALRSGVGLRVQLGENVGALAIRALMIHRATPGNHPQQEVGWGRFEDNNLDRITTDDNEAIVIYQGTLPVGEHLRARVPMPAAPLKGKVSIGATLVISPEVDPNHASAYTRSGLEIAFRPHAQRFGGTEEKPSAHPKTKSFFSAANLYGASECTLRSDGHKWEPCMRNTQTFFPQSLDAPCFDIYYHSRDAGMADEAPQPIGYALVVSVKAPKVTDLYNQIVRSYAQILVPLKPQVRIPIRPTAK